MPTSRSGGCRTSPDECVSEPVYERALTGGGIELEVPGCSHGDGGFYADNLDLRPPELWLVRRYRMIKAGMLKDVGECAFLTPAFRMLILVSVTVIVSRWSMVMMIQMGQLMAMEM